MRRPPGLTGSRGCQGRSRDALTDTLGPLLPLGEAPTPGSTHASNAIEQKEVRGPKRVAKGV